MSLGLLLLILAIVLALVACFVAARSERLLAAAILCLAFAVWLGVPGLTVT